MIERRKNVHLLKVGIFNILRGMCLLWAKWHRFKIPQDGALLWSAIKSNSMSGANKLILGKRTLLVCIYLLAEYWKSILIFFLSSWLDSLLLLKADRKKNNFFSTFKKILKFQLLCLCFFSRFFMKKKLVQRKFIGFKGIMYSIWIHLQPVLFVGLIRIDCLREYFLRLVSVL